MSYYINVHSSSMCIYNLAEHRNLNQNETSWNTNEIVDNKIDGVYTKGSKKRFSAIIKNWIGVIESIEYFNKGKKRKIDSYLRFVTLTLSAKQKHNDKFIKRFMLNRFIRDIRKKHNVKNFVYCSEAQANGNIHFHILIDNYINYKQIQEIWNKIQNTYGYIDKFEQKHKHRNPNSTDIRRLNKVNNISNYLIKYFTKSEGRRKIDGRLWGSSENVKKLSHYVQEFNYSEAMLFNQIQQDEKKRIYSGDYFHLINNINISELHLFSKILAKDVYLFYYQQLVYLNSGLDKLILEQYVKDKRLFMFSENLKYENVINGKYIELRKIENIQTYKNEIPKKETKENVVNVEPQLELELNIARKSFTRFD